MAPEGQGANVPPLFKGKQWPPARLRVMKTQPGVTSLSLCGWVSQGSVFLFVRVGFPFQISQPPRRVRGRSYRASSLAGGPGPGGKVQDSSPKVAASSYGFFKPEPFVTGPSTPLGKVGTRDSEPKPLQWPSRSLHCLGLDCPPDPRGCRNTF